MTRTRDEHEQLLTPYADEHEIIDTARFIREHNIIATIFDVPTGNPDDDTLFAAYHHNTIVRRELAESAQDAPCANGRVFVLRAVVSAVVSALAGIVALVR